MRKLEQVTREVVNWLAESGVTQALIGGLAVDPISRPQDVIDIKNLLTEASLADHQESARVLQLVHERGYDRGKDLLAEFDRYRKPVK